MKKEIRKYLKEVATKILSLHEKEKMSAILVPYYAFFFLSLGKETKSQRDLDYGQKLYRSSAEIINSIDYEDILELNHVPIQMIAMHLFCHECFFREQKILLSKKVIDFVKKKGKFVLNQKYAPDILYGYLPYWVSLNLSSSVTNKKKDVLKKLNSNLVRHGDLIGYVSEGQTAFIPLELKKYKGKVFNLGLAHGATSLILWNCYLRDEAVATKLLQSYLNIIEQYEKTDLGVPAFWPIEEALLKRKGILKKISNPHSAWCYGELSLSMAFLQFAHTFPKSKYSIKAKKMGLKLVDDFQKNKFEDVLKKMDNKFFCHGLVGHFQVLNRVYVLTKKRSIGIMRDQLIKKELAQLSTDLEISNKEDYLLYSSLGAWLALLSISSKRIYPWETLFMIGSIV